MESNMADEATDHAKKQLAENKKAQEHTMAEYYQRMKGKPTPTQEENDLAALGATFHEHEDDGSGPDPYAVKNMEATKTHTKPAVYQTKTVHGKTE
jgi:hypothetical protein